MTRWTVRDEWKLALVWIAHGGRGPGVSCNLKINSAYLSLSALSLVARRCFRGCCRQP